jgi:hypothetical protein
MYCNRVRFIVLFIKTSSSSTKHIKSTRKHHYFLFNSLKLYLERMLSMETSLWVH